MTDLWNTIWDIFAWTGIASIAFALGSLFVLWVAGRCEAKRWRAIQNREPKQSVSDKFGIRAAYLDRPDDSYTEATKREKLQDGVWLGQPRYIRNRLKIDGGRSQL